jgi:hypothetical protein
MLLQARTSLVSSTTKDGNTCAHIAALKGSTLVVEELMKFDKTGKNAYEITHPTTT